MKTLTPPKRTKHNNRIKDVPSAPPAKFPVKLEHILVAVDFSEHSLRALHAAERLAESAGGTLTLLHVMEPIPYLPAPEAYAQLTIEQPLLIKKLQTKLEAIPASEGIDPKLIARVVVKVGIPWNEIVDTAKELNRDAIVIATHGYTGWKHVLMGSTAERVIRHASCPVLVVR